MTRAAERCGIPKEKIVIEGEADALSADATLLQRALANLFDNAAKHGAGVDQVRASIEGSVARFEVLDRGAGFLPGESEQLFQKFRRSGADGSEGLGLGLALVKKIALAHGGRVWASNREGGGAVIGFALSLFKPT